MCVGVGVYVHTYACVCVGGWVNGCKQVGA